MTSPVEEIKVECPKCRTMFADWYRGSVNLDLEGWDAADPEVQDYLRDATTATCPSCGSVVDLDTLIVDGNVWRIGR